MAQQFMWFRQKELELMGKKYFTQRSFQHKQKPKTGLSLQFKKRGKIMKKFEINIEGLSENQVIEILKVLNNNQYSITSEGKAYAEADEALFCIDDEINDVECKFAAKRIMRGY